MTLCYRSIHKTTIVLFGSFDTFVNVKCEFWEGTSPTTASTFYHTKVYFCKIIYFINMLFKSKLIVYCNTQHFHFICNWNSFVGNCRNVSIYKVFWIEKLQYYKSKTLHSFRGACDWKYAFGCLRYFVIGH